jgi:hypothetical protein
VRALSSCRILTTTKPDFFSVQPNFTKLRVKTLGEVCRTRFFDIEANRRRRECGRYTRITNVTLPNTPLAKTIAGIKLSSVLQSETEKSLEKNLDSE